MLYRTYSEECDDMLSANSFQLILMIQSLTWPIHFRLDNDSLAFRSAGKEKVQLILLSFDHRL